MLRASWKGNSPAVSEYHQYLSSIEDIIEEARLGHMFILVDDEDRENEGDLVIHTFSTSSRPLMPGSWESTTMRSGIAHSRRNVIPNRLNAFINPIA